MMRKIVSTVLTSALVSTAVPAATPIAAAQGEAGQARGQGFCRKPAPLPQLGPERGRESMQDMPTPRYHHGSGKMPPPPPPPPMMEMAIPAPVMAPESAISPPPPPASAATAAAAEAAEAADVVVTGMARRAAGSESSPRPDSGDRKGFRPRRQPQPQAGLLTAGEHDDLLNPELYAAYVRRSNLGQQVPALPLLDTARLLTVEVKDAAGRPAPFVPVTVRCSDGNELSFSTQADGTIAFFPGVDRLSDTVQVRAGSGEWRRVDVPRSAGTGRIGFTIGDKVQRVTKLDLVLVVDVTGSMSDELQFLQAELDSIVGALGRRHPELDIRVGMTFYRDQGDEFVTRTFPFTGDIGKARGQIAQQQADGGGDYEEAMQDALVRAAQADWRPDAAKTLLLVADAPPHNEDVARAWLATEHLRAQRVQIVPVGASGVGELAEYVMRAMAAATQSRYAFLTDDSGIGNPHAPPAIDCYLVTRLDNLLTRIIDSQVSGRRIEPADQEVIREVGKYDAGKCVLPSDFRSQID